MRRFILGICLLAAIANIDAAAQKRLTILHVNDTHSHLEPERSGEHEGMGGVIERAAYRDSVVKADGKRNVLLLHAGDFDQGTSYFSVLGGDIEIDLINAMKYDCVTLGNHEFDNMVYVNCYKNDTIAQLFQGDVNIDRILIGLSAFTKQTITPGKTLVFLDEIQEIPPVLSSLKYFYENKPELHVIVAGSLLGVMNMKGESYPVGKVDIMHVIISITWPRHLGGRVITNIF